MNKTNLMFYRIRQIQVALGAYFTAMRQKGRFAGFSLYVSNTTDRHDGYLSYKDGPELPLLDFNTDCFTNGRYVIFYNERFEKEYPVDYETGSVFTELCEVTVTGTVFMRVSSNSP